MVVGEGGAGKTAVVRSLLNLPFVQYWNSTVGIQLTETKTSSKGAWKTVDNGNFASDIANRIIATGGQESKASRRRRSKVFGFRYKPKVDSSHGEEDASEDFGEEDGSSGEEESEEEAEEQREEGMTERGVGDAQVHEDEDQGKEEKLAVKKLVEEVYRYNEDMFVETKQETGAIRMSIWDYGE